MEVEEGAVTHSDQAVGHSLKLGQKDRPADGRASQQAASKPGQCTDQHRCTTGAGRGTAFAHLQSRKGGRFDMTKTISAAFRVL